MKIQIVSVGKTREKHYRAMTKEYLGRLGHYRPVDEIILREAKGQTGEILNEEAQAMQKYIVPGAISVALDERGKQFSSEEFAQQINQWMNRGTRYITFFIGSANGMEEPFKQQCDLRMALSQMTLPHEMAKMLLAEQLYRAMTILRGEPYHK